MSVNEKLLEFFRSEFTAEEQSGFARLKRVPDSLVDANLRHYEWLSTSAKASFVDFCAHWAHRMYGFVVGAPDIDHTRHPFFDRWRGAAAWFESHRNVPK